MQLIVYGVKRRSCGGFVERGVKLGDAEFLGEGHDVWGSGGIVCIGGIGGIGGGSGGGRARGRFGRGVRVGALGIRDMGIGIGVESEGRGGGGEQHTVRKDGGWVAGGIGGGSSGNEDHCEDEELSKVPGTRMVVVWGERARRRRERGRAKRRRYGQRIERTKRNWGGGVRRFGAECCCLVLVLVLVAEKCGFALARLRRFIEVVSFQSGRARVASARCAALRVRVGMAVCCAGKAVCSYTRRAEQPPSSTCAYINCKACQCTCAL